MRQEKFKHILDVFLTYPAVVDVLREANKPNRIKENKSNISDIYSHANPKLTNTVFDYENMLNFLAKAGRDDDPSVRQFARTTYRSVLNAGDAVMY